MSQTGECRQQKHTQHAPSTKTECDYLSGWIKKKKKKTTVASARISPTMMNPRYRWGTQKKNLRRTIDASFLPFEPWLFEEKGQCPHSGTDWSVNVVVLALPREGGGGGEGGCGGMGRWEGGGGGRVLYALAKMTLGNMTPKKGLLYALAKMTLGNMTQTKGLLYALAKMTLGNMTPKKGLLYALAKTTLGNMTQTNQN